MSASVVRSLVCLLLGGCATAPDRGLAQANNPGAVAERQNAIVPDAELQKLVDQLVHSSSLLERAGIVTKLQAFARPQGGQNRVIEQAAFYAAHARQITDEEHINDVPDGRMAVHSIRRVLDVAVLASYLSSDDKRLREFIFDTVLKGGTPYDERDLSDPIVTALADLLSRNLEAPRWDATQVLYWKAPTAVTLEFANRGPGLEPAKRQVVRDSVAAVVQVTGQPNALAGGPIVMDDPRSPGGRDKVVFTPRRRDRESIRSAIRHLDQLARLDEWWVRLYVAEMMRRYDRNPDLRDPKIVRRLRKDGNPVVARAADVPFHHGMSAAERMWWWPFPVKEDESELKYLWRPNTDSVRRR